MSTHVETSRGGSSPSMIQIAATGTVAPFRPSTSTTTVVEHAEGGDPRPGDRRCHDAIDELVAEVAPVSLLDAERRAEHSSLVAPAGMRRIERVPGQLHLRHDSLGRARKSGRVHHPQRTSPCGPGRQ